MAAFFTLLCLLAPACEAQEEAPSWRVLEDGRVRVLFLLSDEDFARYLIGKFPEAVQEIHASLGRGLRARPTVLLIPSRAAFESMVGAEPIAAFAEPSRERIVINLEAFQSSRAALYDVFKHEICHLVLHQDLREENLPKWLDEGVCQWVSGSLGEFLEGRDLSTVRLAITRSPIPLRWLATRFPSRSPGALFQAYEESRLFVEFLAGRRGPEGLPSLLDALAAGMSVDEALKRVFAAGLEELEKEWLEGLKPGTAWFIWISSYFSELLFIFAGLLTMAAGIRLWVRKRRRLRDYDAEDDPP